jgi:hypothetical protein
VQSPARSAISCTRKGCTRPTCRPGDEKENRDYSPREVYATLLDEGVYLCHWRTMDRILNEYDASVIGHFL